VLERPNLARQEAMPLGNGRLGVAVWGEQGFTAQLNRADTFPNRLSPGQVVIPGLMRLAGAADYSGRVDLYNGEFVEHGGEMTATVFAQPGADVLVVEVKAKF
jgi:alpha-L-fucosidase 2